MILINKLSKYLTTLFKKDYAIARHTRKHYIGYWLPTTYKNEFYITSLTGECVRLYPFAVWDELEKKISALPSKKPVVKKFLRATNYFGQKSSMDSQGRILIPQQLRESAVLKDDVRVVGSMDYLEIWQAQTLKQAVENNPWNEDDDSALADIGITG